MGITSFYISSFTLHVRTYLTTVFCLGRYFIHFFNCSTTTGFGTSCICNFFPVSNTIYWTRISITINKSCCILFKFTCISTIFCLSRYFINLLNLTSTTRFGTLSSFNILPISNTVNGTWICITGFYVSNFTRNIRTFSTSILSWCRNLVFLFNCSTSTWIRTCSTSNFFPRTYTINNSGAFLSITWNILSITLFIRTFSTSMLCNSSNFIPL